MEGAKGRPREKVKVLKALKQYNLERLEKLLEAVLVRENELKQSV